jgi:hypothetical protein
MSERIKRAWRAVVDYFTRPDPVTRDLISMQERHAARLLALEAIEVCRSQSAEYDQQTGLSVTGDQQ